MSPVTIVGQHSPTLWEQRERSQEAWLERHGLQNPSNRAIAAAEQALTPPWVVMFAAGFSGVIDLISMLFDQHPTATVASSSRHMQPRSSAGVQTHLIHSGFAPFAPAAYAMVRLVRRRAPGLPIWRSA